MSAPHSVLLGPTLVALQLYIERLAKAVRKKRADAEKTAAEAQHAAAASGHLSASGVLLPQQHDLHIQPAYLQLLSVQ